MLGWSFDICAGLATLARGWPLRLHYLQGRSRASHMTLRDYCNKRNSLNIFLGQWKSAGASPAYIHDVGYNAIKMMAIVGDSVSKGKNKKFL